MILDMQNTFSKDQAITVAAASTNYIDLGAARNIGVGENLYLAFHITSTLVGAGGTITPSLQTDDNTGFSSPATVRTFDAIPALAAAGTKRLYKIEPFSDAGVFERYLRLSYAVGATLTGGTISAFLTHDVQAWKPYAVGFTVA